MRNKHNDFETFRNRVGLWSVGILLTVIVYGIAQYLPHDGASYAPLSPIFQAVKTVLAHAISH